MNLNIFLMDGYGIYVWSAFIFTILICLGLFVRTKKILNKLEKEFILEIENLPQEKLKALKTRKIAKEILVSQSKIY